MKPSCLLFFLVSFCFVGSVSADQLEPTSVNEVKSDINRMDQKMIDMRKRFADLEHRVSRFAADDPTLEPRSSSPIPNTPNEIDEDSIDEVSETEQLVESTAESIPLVEKKESGIKPYSIRGYYAVLFPTQTDLFSNDVEYDWGHHAEARFARHWNKFFIGASMGTKIFKTDRFHYPDPLLAPAKYNMPAKGLNYSIFSSVSLGLEHYFNEKTFITSSLGIGAGWAWDKIKTENVTMWEENDSFIYGMFQVGLGYRLFNSFSALLYYQLDGYGKRNDFDAQYFNQVGASVGIHF
jgi:hypothetical protein